MCEIIFILLCGINILLAGQVIASFFSNQIEEMKFFLALNIICLVTLIAFAMSTNL